MCGYFCIGFIDLLLAGKTLTGYTNFFSQHDQKKTMIRSSLISKMNESNSIKAIDKTNLFEQTKIRISEIIGIENLLLPRD